MTNKKSAIMILFMLIVSISFWSISRYPQLTMKRGAIEMGALSNLITIQGKITHTINYDESQELPLIKRITNTTLNWILANWRGMSFGIAIGAAFLTLLKNSQLKLSNNRFLNSLYGMISGVPLGICSNCVAPVMQASFKGRKKMEYSLSAMFASPMLNIVVLTILFSVFPLNMAIMNTIFVLILILIITPILSHFRGEKHENIACELRNVVEKNISWRTAFKQVIREYIKDLFFLFIRVAPLMIVAGFIGAVAINFIDIKSLANLNISMIAIIPLVAMFATILPMPIAIDLMLAQSMLVAGVPLPLIAVLLFSLGTYSIYSLLIVRQTFSTKIALEIYAIIVFMASILGYVFLVILS